MTGCSIVSKANAVEDSEPNPFSCKGIPKYFDVGEVNTPNHANISMGELVLDNPNIFKNLEMILERLHENAIKNSEREWLFVGADKPPYCLITRLLEKKPFDYYWVSLMSGGDHLNMNILKAFFKITEKIILEPLGKKKLNLTLKNYLIILSTVKITAKHGKLLAYFLMGQ